jgi:hypothetical protein
VAEELHKMKVIVYLTIRLCSHRRFRHFVTEVQSLDELIVPQCYKFVDSQLKVPQLFVRHAVNKSFHE